MTARAKAANDNADTTDTFATKLEESLEAQAVDLNDLHAVVIHRGKSLIMTKKADGSVDFGTVSDLHVRYDNRRVPIAGSKSQEPISKRWMRSSGRVMYPEGVVFSPDGKETAGAYNLWGGFAELQSVPGVACKLFLDHTLKIICDGDKGTFDWLMSWLAHLVQHPEEKPGTAVVMKGIRGAGKDEWGNYVGKMLGRHHVGISQPDHLTGHFNAHMETALLLHVEEGFWAGDRKAESVLKSLITSPRVMIERKGIDAIPIASFVRILITSNENWVVPAAFKERRFFVLNVNGSRAKDTEYFGRLIAERDGGGAAALFEHLKGIDLAGFDVRNPPVTVGLREQALAGLKGVDRWWRDILDEGEMPIGDFGDWESGSIEVERKALRGAYQYWMEGKRFEGKAAGPAEFGKRLRELAPGIQYRKPRVGGEQKRTYIIPSLGECLASFDKLLGMPSETTDGSELI